jgi:hypothetical protein
LALADTLKGTDRRLVLLEATPPDTGQSPSFDGRTSALSNGSRRILTTLGIWEAVVAQAAPISRIHISDRGRFGAARIGAAHAGAELVEELVDKRPELGRLRNAAHRGDLAALRGASLIQDSAFDALLRGVSDAFDLEKEDPRIVDRYDTAPHFRPESIDKKWNNHKHYADHGQSIGRLLLLARRLCERGAGFVTVTTSFVWDMHADINNAPVTEGMRYVGAPFDHAVAAFIDDVEARGLSDKILLVCCGEMGRTPQLNAAGGRDHWGGLAPLLLYGGGLGKGNVVGRSSRDGGQPASDPVTIPDLVGTITRALLDLSEVRLLDSLPKSLQATLSQGRPIPGLG